MHRRRILLPMSRFGRAPQAIRKSTAGMPVWPDGIVGSLAHDDRIAIAALAERAEFQSIGIDVEPAEPIDPDLLNIIATRTERAQALAEPYRGRLLFAIKEAVYEAVYPVEGRFLDHHDVEVRLSAPQIVGMTIAMSPLTRANKHESGGHPKSQRF